MSHEKEQEAERKLQDWLARYKFEIKQRLKEFVLYLERIEKESALSQPFQIYQFCIEDECTTSFEEDCIKGKMIWLGVDPKVAKVVSFYLEIFLDGRGLRPILEAYVDELIEMQGVATDRPSIQNMFDALASASLPWDVEASPMENEFTATWCTISKDNQKKLCQKVRRLGECNVWTFQRFKKRISREYSMEFCRPLFEKDKK